MYGLIFGDRDPVEEPGTASGTPGDWWTVTALSPDAFDHICNGLIYYRSPNRKLDPRLRELGQIRAGWGSGSRFVFSQHCKAMRDNGFSDEQVAAIPHWQVADCFNDVERAVLAYSDCLVQDHGRVPDGIFAALKEHLSDEEILELTYITCTYAMHATISRALHLEFDERPEPIVEMPDPAGRFAGLEVFEEGGSYATITEDR